MEKCLKKTPEVTAIVAVNDMVGYGVLDCIIANGYSVPTDYCLCGFDNIYPSRFLNINMTTVEHSIVNRGKAAMKLLISRLEHNEENQDEIVTHMEYISKIIEGTTTGICKNIKI